MDEENDVEIAVVERVVGVQIRAGEVCYNRTQAHHRGALTSRQTFPRFLVKWKGLPDASNQYLSPGSFR